MVFHLSKQSLNPQIDTDVIKTEYVNLKFRHIQNRIYIKFEIMVQIDSSTRLHQRQIDGCTNVDSAVTQGSIRQLYKCWFDGGTSVDSTVVKASNRRLFNRRIDSWASFESTIVQASNGWLQSSNRRLYWLFWKKY